VMAICRTRWAGQIEWPKVDPCEGCPLLSKCEDAPEESGIEPYLLWLVEINMEAERIEKEARRN